MFAVSPIDRRLAKNTLTRNGALIAFGSMSVAKFVMSMASQNLWWWSVAATGTLVNRRPVVVAHH